MIARLLANSKSYQVEILPSCTSRIYILQDVGSGPRYGLMGTGLGRPAFTISVSLVGGIAGLGMMPPALALGSLTILGAPSESEASIALLQPGGGDTPGTSVCTVQGLHGNPYGQRAPSGQFGPHNRVPRCLRWGGPPPVPTKLVAKNKRGEFIEMAELLPEFRSSTWEDDHSKQETKSKQACSVRDIFTWLQCYCLYVSVLGPQHPSRIPELMAY